jgi:hypothetical protein
VRASYGSHKGAGCPFGDRTPGAASMTPEVDCVRRRVPGVDRLASRFVVIQIDPVVGTLAGEPDCNLGVVGRVVVHADDVGLRLRLKAEESEDFGPEMVLGFRSGRIGGPASAGGGLPPGVDAQPGHERSPDPGRRVAAYLGENLGCPAVALVGHRDGQMPDLDGLDAELEAIYKAWGEHEHTLHCPSPRSLAVCERRVVSIGGDALIDVERSSAESGKDGSLR